LKFDDITDEEIITLDNKNISFFLAAKKLSYSLVKKMMVLPVPLSLCSG
jgi:hypothetical protein